MFSLVTLTWLPNSMCLDIRPIQNQCETLRFRPSYWLSMKMFPRELDGNRKNAAAIYTPQTKLPWTKLHSKCLDMRPIQKWGKTTFDTAL